MVTTEPASHGLLYHYTDSNAVLNILKEGRIRASEARFLNDAEEVIFGLEYVLKQLRIREMELMPQWPGDDSSNQVYQKGVANYVIERIASLSGDDLTLPRVFVTCFCGHGDLLSQWRSYGQGGYALGFDPAMLAKAVTVGLKDSTSASEYENMRPTLELRKVKYRREFATDSLDAELVDRIVPRDIGGPRGGGKLRGVWVALAELAAFKHEAFKEESEWRLIYVIKPDEGKLGASVPRDELRPPVKFRTGPLTIVPYLELALSMPDALKEIVVGPGGDRNLQVSALRHVLEEAHLNDVLIRKSEAPYRGA